MRWDRGTLMVQFEPFFRVHDANPYFHVFDPNSLWLCWRQIETITAHTAHCSPMGGRTGHQTLKRLPIPPNPRQTQHLLSVLYPAENTINMDMNSIQQLRHHLPEFTLNKHSKLWAIYTSIPKQSGLFLMLVLWLVTHHTRTHEISSCLWAVSSLWLALWYDFLVLHPTWQVSRNNISAVVSGPTPPTSFTTRVITYSLSSNMRCPQMKSCFGIGSFFITRGLKHLGLFHSCVPCFKMGDISPFYIFLPGKSWKKFPMTSKKTSMKLPPGGSYSASGMAIPSPTRSPWRGARAREPSEVAWAPRRGSLWWFHGEINGGDFLGYSLGYLT